MQMHIEPPHRAQSSIFSFGNCGPGGARGGAGEAAANPKVQQAAIKHGGRNFQKPSQRYDLPSCVPPQFLRYETYLQTQIITLEIPK